MSALFKTLFGDIRNLGFVGLAVTLELGIVFAGFGREATFVMPIVILSGVAWLATK